MIKINYKSIYNITQLYNPHHFTTLSLKFVFQSLITHALESRRNNTHQFHNKQLASVMQQLY